MNTWNHKVAALTGGLVCLLLTGCQKEELVTPSGAAMNNSALVTDDGTAKDGDPFSTTAPYEQWTIDDGTPVPVGALNGRWSLYSLHGRLFRVDPSEVPWLAIAMSADVGGAGTLRGFGGCNRISGAVHRNGQSLRFIDLGRTRKFCESIHSMEEEFFRVLRATDHFDESGHQLRLLAGPTELAVMYRVDRVPADVAVQ